MKDSGRVPHVDSSTFLSTLLGHARHENKFFYYSYNVQIV